MARPPAKPALTSTHFSRAQREAFIKSLSPWERSCFLSNTRLPDLDADPHPTPLRVQLLATRSPEEQEQLALRFPDEPPRGPTPPASEERRTAEAISDKNSAGFRPNPGIETLLMTLWYVADPLWLDLVARSWRDGVNLGFNGDPGPGSATNLSKLPPNMFDHGDTEQHDVVRKAMEKDISRGNATDFSPLPLFDWTRVIPCGAVPKKDSDVWRFIKNYSFSTPLTASINDESASIKSSWCSLPDTLRRFITNSGGGASSWDVSNAYPFLRIRDCDRHLTTTHVPGLGFSHRLRGDMGLARCGFLWELLGGRVLSTLYFVLSFSTTVHPDGSVICSPPSLSRNFMDEARVISPTRPPSSRGFGDISEELMLTDHARRYFTAPSSQALLRRSVGVNLTDVSRWCDDFFSCAATDELGARNDTAVVAWHNLIGISLADDKFNNCSAHQEFFGITWNLRDGTIYFSDEKIAKVKDALEGFLDEAKHSLREWLRLQGLLNFFARVFPHMAYFTLAIKKQAVSASFTVDKEAPRLTKNTPIHAASPATVEELLLWLAFLETMPRSLAPALLSPEEVAEQSSVIAHTDWSGSPGKGVVAAVVLSHGFYCYEPMDPSLYEPVDPKRNKVHASAVGEAAAVIALIHSHPEVFRNRCATIFTDNEGFTRRFNRSKTKKGSAALDARIQDLALLLSSLNARLALIWTPGSECLADLLTRTLQEKGEQRLTTRLAELLPFITFSKKPLSFPTPRNSPSMRPSSSP